MMRERIGLGGKQCARGGWGRGGAGEGGDQLTEHSTCIMSPACCAPASATAPATRLGSTRPGLITAKIACAPASRELTRP